MDPIPAFFLSLALGSLLIARVRLSPFLGLVMAAYLHGLLTGMPDVTDQVSQGLGRIFSALSLVIFSGAVIAEHLRQSGAIDRIVSDLNQVAGGRGTLASGVSGYLLSLPVMCCITSYIILEPVVGSLQGDKSRNRFALAVASVISFVLVYPSPAVLAGSASLGVAPLDALRLGLPLSLVLLALSLLYMRWLFKGEATRAAPCPATSPERRAGTIASSRVAAWSPIALPLSLILLGLFASTGPLRMIGDPRMALLIGAILSLAFSGGQRQGVVMKASRRAGIILLDLCGAGALGQVVASSGMGEAFLDATGGFPLLLIPFALAALIQLAQGSRVVTVTVAAGMLEGYPLDPEITLMLISSGAFVLSYLTDPYFWLVKETTGAGLREAFLGYTLPLTLLGLASLGMIAIVEAFI